MPGHEPVHGQCLCGTVHLQIDFPARWAWHDHSPSTRTCHGAAYATYVGSWSKRFRFTQGEGDITRFQDDTPRAASAAAAAPR